MKSRLLASSVSIIVGVAASLTLTLTGVTEATPSKSVSDTTQFVRLMKKGVSSAYVATYDVSNYDFFSTGLITVANLPPRPGTKAPANADGYSSDVEMSYVFRGKDGHTVQWIHDETRVSACVGGPFHSGNSSLQRSRPFQYIPSNGFAEEGVGFVPEVVLQNFENFDPTFDARSPVVFIESWKRFGSLKCVRQAQVHVKDSPSAKPCALIEAGSSCRGCPIIPAAQSASY